MKQFDVISEFSDDDRDDATDFKRANSIMPEQKEDKIEIDILARNMALLLGNQADAKGQGEAAGNMSKQTSSNAQAKQFEANLKYTRKAEPSMTRAKTLVDIEMDANSDFDDEELDPIDEAKEGALSVGSF